MRDFFTNLTFTFVGILLGLAGGIMFSQTNPPSLQIAWLLLSAGIFLLLIFLALRLLNTKPKIIFGKVHIGTGDGERNHFFVWYLPIMNEELEGWRSLFAERNSAKRCTVMIEFVNKDKLLGQACYWSDLPTGMELLADSNPKELALVYSNNSKTEISLADENISTKQVLPPYLLPRNENILTTVNVMSRGHLKAKVEYNIFIKDNGQVTIDEL